MGAFNSSGICVGLMRIDHQQAANSMFAFGDDILTAKHDGLSQGEAMLFKVHAVSDNKEFELEINYEANAPNQGTYADHGISVVDMVKIKSATATGESFANIPQLNIYPNPTSGLLNIALEGGTLDKGQILLNNLNGQMVLQQNFESSALIQLDLNKQPKGIYYLKIVAGDIVKIEKVVLK